MMKKFLGFICCAGMGFSSFAQNSISLTTDKTTSLIFPFPITHVDRGTKDVLVQQVKEANNILLVKAGAVNFPETNLSVVTNDGSFYSFTVAYKREPVKWVYELPSKTSFTVASYAKSILNNPQRVHGIRDRKLDMLIKVSGIYIQGNTMYYQLQFDNQGPIDYDIAFLHFYIRDKKKAKRTAVQENEMLPVYVAGNTKAVKANSISKVVIALKKFTIPDAKYFAIEIKEKNGGRHLLLKVHNNKIIKARLLH
jgi:conjugative transposon TraN protein